MVVPTARLFRNVTTDRIRAANIAAHSSERVPSPAVIAFKDIREAADSVKRTATAFATERDIIHTHLDYLSRSDLPAREGCRR